jgi:uncharacterized protein YeaO (DUF488 family)
MSSLAAERLRVKRAYEAPTDADGCRVLVERLWPRGLRKADAAVDVWLKDIAPSTELRSGTAMTWRVGPSSSDAIKRNFAPTWPSSTTSSAVLAAGPSP